MSPAGCPVSGELASEMSGSQRAMEGALHPVGPLSRCGKRCGTNSVLRFVVLLANSLISHLWPKRRLKDPRNHVERRPLQSEDALQTTPFRRDRAWPSSHPTRPVTPEVAGSSPVAPVLLKYLQISRFVLSVQTWFAGFMVR